MYKIKFSRPYKKESKLDVGYFYVKNKSYAIIEIEYSVLLGKSNYRRRHIGQNVLYTTIIRFKEYNKNMYLFYISHKTFKLNNLRTFKDFDSNKDNMFRLGNLSHEEILFTEIITDKQTIDLRLQQPWNDNLFKPRPYNATFWKNYNILLESKEQQKLIKDLEKKVKLKEQYKQAN